VPSGMAVISARTARSVRSSISRTAAITVSLP
jgi:hypothetical protein